MLREPAPFTTHTPGARTAQRAEEAIAALVVDMMSAWEDDGIGNPSAAARLLYLALRHQVLIVNDALVAEWREQLRKRDHADADADADGAATAAAGAGEGD